MWAQGEGALLLTSAQWSCILALPYNLPNSSGVKLGDIK